MAAWQRDPLVSTLLRVRAACCFADSVVGPVSTGRFSRLSNTIHDGFRSNTMRFFGQQQLVLVSLATVSMLAVSAASAQSTATATEQVLDRVVAVSPKAVLEMSFNDPAAANPFDVGITTSNGFSSCQLTAKRGLFCLDQNPVTKAPGRVVRNWDPVFADAENGSPYFSCEDPVLGLDTSKTAESCTSITADDAGAVVIAGKRKGGYNLFKVARAADLYPDPETNKACRNGWAGMSTPGLCYKVLLPRDRPLLVDTTYAKLNFTGVVCSGVIGLENRTALMFFRDPDDPANAAECPAEFELVGFKGWQPALDRNEVLQGAATVVLDNGDSYALTVSNTGRVRAKQTNSSNPSFGIPIFRGAASYDTLASLRAGRPTATRCSSASQKFGIRRSVKSGLLYVTDHNFCEVSALAPVSGPALSGLSIVQFGGSDLVLPTTTNDAAATAYPPLEPTLAPGISIDLSKCLGTEGCGLVAADDGKQAAVLSNVKLASNAKGMTLFQIKFIPDCRWIAPADRPAECSAAISDETAPPQEQYLNITPLLPKEVTDQYPPNSLPAMWISPQYRGQYLNGYRFEAFFGVPQAGVVFQDVFDLEFYVEDLTGGASLGCEASPPLQSSVASLSRWDIAVTVSEKVQVVGKPGGLSHSDILVNNGCGSTVGGGSRWSAYAYNLEPTPSVYPHTPLNGVAPNDPPDDYFVHLLVDLFYDLDDARSMTACQAGGPLFGVVTPTGTQVCNALESTWINAKDKLGKCLAGANYPKKSEAINNCNSFDSQMANYRGILDATPICTPASTSCADKDNRLGELKARVATIRHVFKDRLVPSIPPNGFEKPAFEDVTSDGVLSRSSSP